MEAEGDPQSNDGDDVERLDLVILASAKRMKLSFAELNEFRLRDFMKFAGIWSGKEEKKPREATQKDIDAFYA